MTSITEIDGSVLEGGGQILRLAVSFSSILRKPVRITKIRANRSKAGLRPQHLKGVEMACELCSGSLRGAAINSTEVTLEPGILKGGKFEVDTKTAGSVSLLVQVTLPIALFSPTCTRIKMKGGTNADMAPPIDFTLNVFLPILNKFGAQCSCKIIRRGYYPKGGGEIELDVPPIKILSAVNLTDFGQITRIWGRSYVAGVLPIKIAHKMADAANRVLSSTVSSDAPIDVQRVKETSQEAFGNGSGIVVYAATDTGCILSGSTIGNSNISPYDAGTKAATELIQALEGKYCVDSYTQDQIIVLMALAKGKSVVKCGPLTEHTKTAIYITEKLTNAKFIFEKSGDHLLECEGIGFKNIYFK